MQNNEFEEMFDKFLESKDYDQASGALFSIVRAAFLAGMPLVHPTYTP